MCGFKNKNHQIKNPFAGYSETYIIVEPGTSTPDRPCK